MHYTDRERSMTGTFLLIKISQQPNIYQAPESLQADMTTKTDNTLQISLLLPFFIFVLILPSGNISLLC